MEYSLETLKIQNVELLQNVQSLQEEIKNLSTAKSAIKKLLKTFIKKAKPSGT